MIHEVVRIRAIAVEIGFELTDANDGLNVEKTHASYPVVTVTPRAVAFGSVPSPDVFGLDDDGIELEARIAFEPIGRRFGIALADCNGARHGNEELGEDLCLEAGC